MKNLLLFLPLILLFACAPEQNPEETLQLPADSIIPEAQMIILLADVHLIEAALLIARNRGTNTRDIGHFYYDGLFKKYRISQERYQKNLEFYREDPDYFIQLYKKVNKELKEREKNFVEPPPD